MSHYAEITDGIVTNVAVCDDPAFAEQQGWIGPVDTIDPQPGVGWSYDASNQTWTAPTPPAPTAQQQAQQQLQQLLAELPTQLSNANTDAQTLSTLTAGQTLTAAQVAAVQRHASGWPQLLQALDVVVKAAGLA